MLFQSRHNCLECAALGAGHIFRTDYRSSIGLQGINNSLMFVRRLIGMVSDDVGVLQLPGVHIFKSRIPYTGCKRLGRVYRPRPCEYVFQEWKTASGVAEGILSAAWFIVKIPGKNATVIFKVCHDVCDIFSEYFDNGSSISCKWLRSSIFPKIQGPGIFHPTRVVDPFSGSGLRTGHIVIIPAIIEENEHC